MPELSNRLSPQTVHMPQKHSKSIAKYQTVHLLDEHVTFLSSHCRCRLSDVGAPDRDARRFGAIGRQYRDTADIDDATLSSAMCSD
jgi:hypothetical protein